MQALIDFPFAFYALCHIFLKTPIYTVLVRSPWSPYVISSKQTLFRINKPSTSHGLVTRGISLGHDEQVNEQVNKFWSLVLPIQLIGNVTFHCCRNVFLNDLAHAQSQLLGSHRLK